MREDRHSSKLNLSFTLFHISLDYLTCSRHKPSHNTKYLGRIILWVMVIIYESSDEYIIFAHHEISVFITELRKELILFNLFQNASFIQNYFYKINETENGFVFTRNKIARKQNF